MKMRDEVQIGGIPFVWSTNLENEDIPTLYGKISADPEFVQSGITVKGLAISMRLFEKAVPLKDGFCWCIGFTCKIWATYRSTSDWEIWNARQAEIKELKQEQAEQQSVEKLLFRTTDQHLRNKALEALQKGRFEESAFQIEQRLEHAKQIEREFEENFRVKWLRYSSAVCDEVLRMFCWFPTTDPGITFLKKNANFWYKYLRFAESYETWSRFSKEELFSELDSYHFTNRSSKEVVFGEINNVFRKAVKQFPNEGVLFKKICLFWERKNMIALAIDYCRLAVENQLRDDTKNGFPFRLKRLVNKARKIK